MSRRGGVLAGARAVGPAGTNRQGAATPPGSALAQLTAGGSQNGGPRPVSATGTWGEAYGMLGLPRPPSQFTDAAFSPYSPILAVPINEPDDATGQVPVRREEYRVGWNLPVGQPGTEGLKLADFATLRSLAELYSVARSCIQYLKSEITGLEWDILPTKDAAKSMRNDEGKMREFGERRGKAIKFFKRPDPDYFSWQSWLSDVLEEMLVYDALSLVLRPKWGRGLGRGLLGSDLDSLNLVNGPTIRPLYSVLGSTPRPPAVAYQQFLYGVPRSDWMSVMTGRDIEEAGLTGTDVKAFRGSQLLYLREVPRRHTPYGMPPVERALVPIMSGLSKQGYQLDYYKEGTVPAVYISPGGDLSPNQIRELQDALNAVAGDPAFHHKVIVLPSGSTVNPQRPASLADQFDEIVMSQTCMGFGVSPMAIGIMPKVSTTTSPGAANQMAKMTGSNQEKGSQKPRLIFIANICDFILGEVCRQTDMRFVFDGMEEEEDEETKTNLIVNQVSHALLTVDEGRDELGRQPFGTPKTTEPGIFTPTGFVTLAEQAQQQEQQAAMAQQMQANLGGQAAPGGEDGKGPALPAGPSGGGKPPAKPSTGGVKKPEPKPGETAAAHTAAAQAATTAQKKPGASSAGKAATATAPPPVTSGQAAQQPVPPPSDAVDEALAAAAAALIIKQLIDLMLDLYLGQVTLLMAVEDGIAAITNGYLRLMTGATNAAASRHPGTAPLDYRHLEAVAAQRGEAQRTYLTYLAQSVTEAKRTGASPTWLPNRVRLYAESTAPAWHEAYGKTVQAAHPDYEIIWRLGEAEHCSLCVMRDGQSFTFETLPGWPGDGGFGGPLCEGGPNCHCHLDYMENGELVDQGENTQLPQASGYYRQQLADITAARQATLEQKDQFLAGLPNEPGKDGTSVQSRARDREWLRRELAHLANQRIQSTGGYGGVSVEPQDIPARLIAQLLPPNASATLADVPITAITDAVESMFRGKLAAADLTKGQFTSIMINVVAEVVKVGPHGYIHGWKRVGPVTGDEKSGLGSSGSLYGHRGGADLKLDWDKREHTDKTHDIVPVLHAPSNTPMGHITLEYGRKTGPNGMRDPKRIAAYHADGTRVYDEKNGDISAGVKAVARHHNAVTEQGGAFDRDKEPELAGYNDHLAGENPDLSVRSADYIAAYQRGRDQARQENDVKVGVGATPEWGKAATVRAVTAELEALARHLTKGRAAGTWERKAISAGAVADLAALLETGAVTRAEAVKAVLGRRYVSLDGVVVEEADQEDEPPSRRNAAGWGGPILLPHDEDGIQHDRSDLRPRPVLKGAADPHDPNPVEAQHVYEQLLRNYPPKAIKWVKKVRWIGPIEVPLDRVDVDDVRKWAASHQADRVDHFADRLKAGEPVNAAVSVQEPGEAKVKVIDGHHRYLGAKKAGEPFRTYIGFVDSDGGPWDQTHVYQFHQGDSPANKAVTLSKEAAGYRQGVDALHRCRNCTMFIAFGDDEAGKCTLVEGEIRTDAVCDHWNGKRADKGDHNKVVAAGIAVVALDTGRVLMLQRALPEKGEKDPAAGTWEFPGGRLESGEGPFEAARREWEEETGCELPGGKRGGRWRAGGGIYRGFVWEVEHETDVPIHEGRDAVDNPDDPDGDRVEALAWWDVDHLKANPAVRTELAAGLADVLNAIEAGAAKKMLAPGVKAWLPDLLKLGGDDPKATERLDHYWAEGDGDHHLTLAYLGPDVNDDELETALNLVRAAAPQHEPLTIRLGGLGTFPPSESSHGKTPAFVPVEESEELLRLRGDLADLSRSAYTDWHPHVTLAYLNEGQERPAPVPTTSFQATHVTIHRGDSVWRVPLGEAAAMKAYGLTPGSGFLGKVGPEGYIHGYICVRPPCGKAHAAKVVRDPQNGKVYLGEKGTGEYIGKLVKNADGTYTARHNGHIIDGGKVLLAGKYDNHEEAARALGHYHSMRAMEQAAHQSGNHGAASHLSVAASLHAAGQHEAALSSLKNANVFTASSELHDHVGALITGMGGKAHGEPHVPQPVAPAKKLTTPKPVTTVTPSAVSGLAPEKPKLSESVPDKVPAPKKTPVKKPKASALQANKQIHIAAIDEARAQLAAKLEIGVNEPLVKESLNAAHDAAAAGRFIEASGHARAAENRLKQAGQYALGPKKTALDELTGSTGDLRRAMDRDITKDHRGEDPRLSLASLQKETDRVGANVVNVLGTNNGKALNLHISDAVDATQRGDFSVAVQALNRADDTLKSTSKYAGHENKGQIEAVRAHLTRVRKNVEMLTPAATAPDTDPGHFTASRKGDAGMSSASRLLMGKETSKDAVKVNADYAGPFKEAVTDRVQERLGAIPTGKLMALGKMINGGHGDYPDEDALKHPEDYLSSSVTGALVKKSDLDHQRELLKQALAEEYPEANSSRMREYLGTHGYRASYITSALNGYDIYPSSTPDTAAQLRSPGSLPPGDAGPKLTEVEKKAWIHDQVRGMQARHEQYLSPVDRVKLDKQARTKATSNLVHAWAVSSNDRNAIMLAMHHAAIDEFGLERTASWKDETGDLADEVQAILAEHKPALKAFLRAQHDLTQEAFKRAGITHIKLYRGMRWYKSSIPSWARNESTGGKLVAANEMIEPHLRPLNSWSSSVGQATKFYQSYGGGDHKLMVAASVPVDRVLAFPQTGFGCLGEHEFVVMQTPGLVKVHKSKAG